MSSLTNPLHTPPDALTRDYEAAMQRAARHEQQQIERRAKISRGQFLTGRWHGEPENLQCKQPPPSEAVGSTAKE